MGKPEATTRAEIVEEEQLLFAANLAVISLCCLRKERFVFGELLLVWEGNSINSLQRVFGGVAKEIRSRVLQVAG